MGANISLSMRRTFAYIHHTPAEVIVYGFNNLCYNFPLLFPIVKIEIWILIIYNFKEKGYVNEYTGINVA